MQFKNLDKTDTLILKYLSENGRLSNAELGRLVIPRGRAGADQRINQRWGH
ncbi:AsnC family transcriptional regulator [Paenibacillus ginsengihumi]|uniref:AsnC family transcriptional regulator n=1 Tax=Paenibacillus ginsengihumi TaxID=431596 RepID=UPI0003A9FD9F